MTIRERRKKSPIKIKGILDCLGISRSTYYLIEKGKRPLSETEKTKLDKLFGGIENGKIN
ncbi:helix-turn-helix domain-containing protein [Clostridium saccharoperbutylacetonicum]|uniref:helix-turn-helix domain-containing protein n=1 Tax=Clostridium saccharoperbutylacetonicum TaxID=36745 RepID=UPI0039EBC0CB